MDDDQLDEEEGDNEVEAQAVSVSGLGDTSSMLDSLPSKGEDAIREVQRQRNLEQALFIQMEMQKKLHEQLEVIPDTHPTHIKHGSISFVGILLHSLFLHISPILFSSRYPDTARLAVPSACQVTLSPLHVQHRMLVSCDMLGLFIKLSRFNNQPCFTSQSQRQLQLSLEAHGRYITSLIEREGLQHRLLPQLVAAANPSLARTVPALAALTASIVQGSSAQTSDQQTHYMPLPISGASDFSPHSLLAGGFAHLPPTAGLNSSASIVDTAKALDVSPSPLSRPMGVPPSNPFASISQGMYGEPSSPGLLLNTDLQAAAAAWDDQQRNILTGAGSRPLPELAPSASAGRVHSAPSLNPSRPLDTFALSPHPSAANSLPSSQLPKAGQGSQTL